MCSARREGVALLGGQPVTEQVGSVGLAFQHARLQLQRATVAADLRAAGAADDAAVGTALASVGLDVAGISVTDASTSSVADSSAGWPWPASWPASRRSWSSTSRWPAWTSPARRAWSDCSPTCELRSGLTVVVISHDLEGMDRVCDRVVRLDRGRVVADETRVVARVDESGWVRRDRVVDPWRRVSPGAGPGPRDAW